MDPVVSRSQLGFLGMAALRGWYCLQVNMTFNKKGPQKVTHGFVFIWAHGDP